MKAKISTLAHNSYALLHTPTFDVINNMHALTFDVTDSMVYRHTRHVSKSNNHQNWHRLQLLPSVGSSNDRSHYFLMHVFTPLGLAIILVHLKFSKKKHFRLCIIVKHEKDFVSC